MEETSLRKKRHLWQIRHLKRNRAAWYRALSLAAVLREWERARRIEIEQRVVIYVTYGRNIIYA